MRGSQRGFVAVLVAILVGAAVVAPGGPMRAFASPHAPKATPVKKKCKQGYKLVKGKCKKQ